jgi:hypothetical protein
MSLFGCIFPIHHRSVKITDDKIYVKPNINCDNVNIYDPINYPALFDSLLPYLEIHDLLKLINVSKRMQLTISKLYKECNIKNSLIDAIKYDCVKCTEDMFYYFPCNNMSPQTYLTAIKYKSLKCLHIMKHGLWSINRYLGKYIPPTEILDTLENANIEDCFIHEIIIEASKHDNDTRTILFEYITKHINIGHLKSISIICQNPSQKMFKNMIKYIDYDNYMFSSEYMVLMLHRMCLFNMVDDVIHNIKSLTQNNYPFLIDLLKKNYKNYDYRIVDIFIQYLIFLSIAKDDIPFIIDLVDYVDSEHMTLEILTSNVDDAIKMSCVRSAYKFNLSEYVARINETRELDILSIQQATNYGDGEVYINKLSTGEHLQFIIDAENLNVKERLIYKISDNHKISCWDMEKMKTIIKWVITNDNKIAMEHFINLKSLDDTLKCMLVPKVYEYDIYADLTFLSKTEEFNILSIKQAIKYNRTYFYGNMLSIQRLLKLVEDTSNTEFKELLLSEINMKQKTIEKNKIQNKKSTLPVYNEKNTLPITYKRKNYSYTYYDNSKIHINIKK